MKHYPANKKNITRINRTARHEDFKPEIMADSLEVMENYSHQKIILLHSALEKLNVADHAARIIHICQQIRNEKKLLHQIILKKEQEINKHSNRKNH